MRQSNRIDSYDVGRLVNQAVERSGGVKFFAAKLGLSKSFVYAVLDGKKSPPKSILNEVGLKRVITYEFVESANVQF